MENEWKPVPGWEGAYEIRRDGAIRSLDRLVPNRAGLKPIAGKASKVYVSSRGYPYVHLSRKGQSFSMDIHRLLALTFIPNPLGKREVNHKDGNKKNFSLSNLEWVTPSENCRHAFRLGLRFPGGPRGTSTHSAKLDEQKVRQIKREYVTGVSCGSLAKKYGVHSSTIWKALKGVKWSHVT